MALNSNQIQINRQIKMKIVKDLLESRGVCLVGPMGCGKSTLCKDMAKNLDIVSYDLDRQVSKYAKLSVSDIFTLKGERHFRNLESSCLSSVLAEQCLKSEAGFVIALGGGAFAQKSIRDTLNMYNVFSIYIDMDRTTLFNRIKDSKTRPLISSLPTDKAKLKKMNEIINSRLDTYKKADITLKIHGELKRDAQLDKLFNAIVNWYEST